MKGDDIVISGFSAYFPQADHLVEFKEKLYAGVEMVTEDDLRWPPGYNGMPKIHGKIKDLSRFDAEFFSTPPKQANLMDPQLRLLLETSYEAILDAGYDPKTLRKRKIGVFIGNSASETVQAFKVDREKEDAYVVLGCHTAMFSNMISYSLDFQGPSMTIDTACSSTIVALSEAVLAIRSGRCEAAIVGGASITLDPYFMKSFRSMGILSGDGKCRPFDAQVRLSAHSSFKNFPDARRVYAKVLNANTNSDGYKEEGATFPSAAAQEKLLRDAYAEVNVDPTKVVYVEAHGTGTAAGGIQELQAISSVMCSPEREKTLLIGSVKSNMGHAESASGIPSVAKVILAMETGTIAATLNFNEPHPDIPSLHDGRVKVVDQPTPFDGGMIGICSQGIGGANAHVILESNPSAHVESLPRAKPYLPRLILMAGRSEEGLMQTLNRVEAEGPYPDSGYALLNRIGQRSVKQFPYRGYAIVPVDDVKKEVVKVVEGAPSEKRPLWFVFTGVGCQWNGMGRQMMQFEPFAKSIRNSYELLKEKLGEDLMDMLISDEPRCKTIKACFLSITAVQVALVDTLQALGIQPDGMLGHSAGEVGCAYADGGFTAEQALLCAYWRGRSLEMGYAFDGAMAAVGKSYLNQRHAASAGSAHQRRKAVLEEPGACLCSAEYHTNNFLNPVLFCEALKYVPVNAILLEIGPHCLLQAHWEIFIRLESRWNLSVLYPPVPWPLPRGTPNIGHLVAWDHSQTWEVAKWDDFPSPEQFLANHHGKPLSEAPVIMEDVKLQRFTILPTTGGVRFQITVMPISGEFEVCEGGAVVCKGRMRLAAEGETVLLKDPPEPYAKLKWENNWVAFLDAMVHTTFIWNPEWILSITPSTTCVGLVASKYKVQKLNSVQRRPTLHSPIIEEYRFVPYMDNEITRRDRDNLLWQYAEVCNCIGRRVMEGTKERKSHSEIPTNSCVEVPEELLNRYVDNMAPNKSLLQLLVAIQKHENGPETLPSTAKSAILSSAIALEEDILSTGLLDEDPLRDILDVVVENAGSIKLRVVELADKSVATLGPRVSSLVSMYSVSLKIEYTVVLLKASNLAVGKMSEGMAPVSQNRSSASTEVAGADLVMAFCGVLNASDDLNNLADTMASRCKERGFVLLSHRTALTEAEVLLSRLSGVPFQVYPMETTTAALRLRGFRLVALKSNNLSTLLLFRKVKGDVDATKQTIVHVRNGQFSWVESLKQEAVDCDTKPTGENVWLLAEDAGGDAKTTTQFAYLHVQTRGDLSSLQWYESPVGLSLTLR
ncbi:hypothetical protein MTO96_039375 [Rhipicephalus appendiculatus]